MMEGSRGDFDQNPGLSPLFSPPAPAPPILAAPLGQILYHIQPVFLSDPGVSGVRSMGSSLSNYVTKPPFADLTDVTLADEDTNPILTDGANRTFQSNVAMQVTKPGGQLWNQTLKQCK